MVSKNYKYSKNLSQQFIKFKTFLNGLNTKASGTNDFNEMRENLVFL